jgi:hypothetical protein
MKKPRRNDTPYPKLTRAKRSSRKNAVKLALKRMERWDQEHPDAP